MGRWGMTKANFQCSWNLERRGVARFRGLSRDHCEFTIDNSKKILKDRHNLYVRRGKNEHG